MERVLICGVSTRAAAESAARAGFAVTAVDAYADLDQHPAVRALSIGRDFGMPPTAAATARAARQVGSDAAVYLSSFENHPRAIRTLAAGRTLWGNAPEVVRRVRDPLILAAAFRARGFAVPAARAHASSFDHSDADGSRDWLRKPLRSGGGQRVRRANSGRVGRGSYLQERIDGTPGAVVFAAAGGRAVPLGVSRQLVGDPHFGGTGYRYCGSIMAAADDAPFDRGADVVAAACALAQAAAAEFGLVGVNGIDFVARDGVPHPIELNPRWSASMELVERLFGCSVFRAHADACAHATLPSLDLRAERRCAPVVGKAIVYARRVVTAGDTRRWLDDATVRDVPHPGETFAPGQPICTVLAVAADAQRCYDALVARAARIYVQLEDALTAPAGLVDSVRT